MRGRQKRREQFRRPFEKVRRRRRPLLLTLLFPFLKAVVAVGLPLVTVLWFLDSPHFAFAELSIETGDRVEISWVQEALAPLRGRNLLLLPLSEVEGRLAHHPWVAAVRIRKRLPDHLAVTLEERRPEAVARTADGSVYLDGWGRPIAPVQPPDDEGLLVIRLPEITIEASRGALEVARRLIRARPQWGLALQEVEVLGEHDFRLHTAALPFALLVREDTCQEGVRRLARVLPGLAARMGFPSTADLRLPNRIVLEPAASSRRAVTPPVDT